METSSLKHLYVCDINCGHYSHYCDYSLPRLLNKFAKQFSKINESNLFVLY